MFALQSQFRGNSEGDVVFRQVFKGRSYFDAVAHVVEQRVVDWLADVAHGPLHVARGDDLVGARGVLVCGQDADLATRHLLLVNVHSLHSEEKEDKRVVGHKIFTQCLIKYIKHFYFILNRWKVIFKA